MGKIEFPEGPNRFITITYQSNNDLNEEHDNQVKQEIAEILVDTVEVKNIHSYVHGQIIIEVSQVSVLKTLNNVINALSKSLANLSTPPLIYSVDLASFMKEENKIRNFIYVQGSEDMNKNFIESIKEFWPKK